MLSMELHAAIRHAFYVERRSIRDIARELAVSRQSVRKAVEAPEPAPYTLHQPRPAPVLGPFHAQIQDLLAQNDHLPRKQRFTSHTIYKTLEAAGYTGCESNVRTYIAALRRDQRRPPVFLPLEFDPGTDAQVDWGVAAVILGGVQQDIQLFVMRLCYSRRLFVYAYPTQRQECFFDAHVQAFTHFHGIPHRLSYDNLTTAVQKVFQGHTRQEQRAFTTFRSHYLFDAHFCTVGQGHEKGGVEHGVGYARRNFMVPLPVADSFAALNAQLLGACLADDQRTVSGHPTSIYTAWQQEQPLLRPLPPTAFACCVHQVVTLTPYSQVIFDTNRYSVPVTRARRQLTLRAYPFWIEILDETTLVARHARCYDHHQDVFDPLHYLPLLEQRPGAFDHAKPIRRWRDQWPPAYKRLLYCLRERSPDGTGIREFIRILRLHEQYPAILLDAAIARALEYGCLSVDGVLLCLRELQHPHTAPAPLDLSTRPQLASIGGQTLDLTQYHQLLLGES